MSPASAPPFLHFSPPKRFRPFKLRRAPSARRIVYSLPIPPARPSMTSSIAYTNSSISRSAERNRNRRQLARSCPSSAASPPKKGNRSEFESASRRSPRSESRTGPPRTGYLHLRQRERHQCGSRSRCDQTERRALRSPHSERFSGYRSRRPPRRRQAAAFFGSPDASRPVSRLSKRRRHRAHAFPLRHGLGAGRSRHSLFRHHARRLRPGL